MTRGIWNPLTIHSLFAIGGDFTKKTKLKEPLLKTQASHLGDTHSISGRLHQSRFGGAIMRKTPGRLGPYARSLSRTRGDSRFMNDFSRTGRRALPVGKRTRAIDLRVCLEDLLSSNLPGGWGINYTMAAWLLRLEHTEVDHQPHKQQSMETLTRKL
ncbi:hypothetical protein CEXT_574371 [Caerostris extrusa]|uniref:Uncharacterized protein n=1 Tax=Caerostris extrusa TaxID=172846 RepID=A0AAV4X9T6_CAEEX|nr:hypothetical protein CEXT_574371 [Caerostris extrusa]